VPELGMATIACERLAEFGFSITTTRGRALLDKGSPRIDRKVQRRSWQAITLRGVKVRYSNDRVREGFELGPIDLELQPSELLFIIGGNGSGKSTLAKALTGLYRPVEGQVLLDGRPVREDEREAYSSLFSAVFSEFHVFDYVVGAGGAREDVGACARDHLARFGLADKVTIAKRRLSTTTALSHGQRKRLALLCAYLEDRPIYVLDEWAADQDPIFKRFFYEVLLPELKSRGKCVVVITHDDQYFRWADRVLKLQDGRMLSVTEERSVA
jgi:putative ATP-binding cassette transporter